KPEDGKRTEREHQRLRGEQQVRARPRLPQEREHEQHRLEVDAEPRDLLAVKVGLLQEVPMRACPDRLHDVPQVEAPVVERAVTGAPQARPWKTLFGMPREALPEPPKIPSATRALRYSAGSASYGRRRSPSTFAGRSASRRSSWPLPTTRTGSPGTSRAASRI